MSSRRKIIGAESPTRGRVGVPKAESDLPSSGPTPAHLASGKAKITHVGIKVIRANGTEEEIQ